MFTLIFGGLGFGFAILAVVLVVVAAIKGKRALSGTVVPLQQIHEIFNPGQQNMIEIVEEDKAQRDDSGDDNAHRKASRASARRTPDTGSAGPEHANHTAPAESGGQVD